MEKNELFELHIVPQLIELWKTFGLNKDERDSEKQVLNNLLIQEYQKYVESIKTKCKNMQNEITNVLQNYESAMKSYGYSKEEINEALKAASSTLPLRQQLQIANSKYDAFLKSCQERKDKMQFLMNELNKVFTALGIPKEERGEFSELGETDFTLERQARMQKKLNELQTEKQKRIDIVQKLKGQITSLASELSLTIEEDITTFLGKCVVTKQAIQSLKDCAKRLQSIREERVASISQMAVEINHLWDLLEISEEERNHFIARHSTLGIDVINSCQAEIKRLSAQKEEKLQTLIVIQRKELNELYETLHIPIEERNVIKKTNDISDEFSQTEKEILRLKSIYIEFHDIIEVINQREEILRNWNECKVASSDPNRLMSRTHEGAKRLMKEAKARTDYKTVLPKIERKLFSMLKEHKQKTGKDFMWDGELYIKKLESKYSLAENDKNVSNTPKPRHKATKVKNRVRVEQTTTPTKCKTARCKSPRRQWK
ncbi:Microtubule associated protein (MAP65/ASE1 family) [Histomonas meleagridis]|uniref:Microtubule associated protein (MAP65/ASE1 family) n=1 Tax=Histomonas meleagridis TaxID=135588 RepID=UPI00355A6E7F|nr:Microtubule associated protein (MAP65/ASE1 family) [Histomonas meleagridis]KAH0800502.1 Microtubule associated protein (MAP65/ASE1 family) [Histomonas meleagridis]